MPLNRGGIAFGIGRVDLDYFREALNGKSPHHPVIRTICILNLARRACSGSMYAQNLRHRPASLGSPTSGG